MIEMFTALAMLLGAIAWPACIVAVCIMIKKEMEKNQP